eukprot:1034303-Prymnesium_polylepis.2
MPGRSAPASWTMQLMPSQSGRASSSLSMRANASAAPRSSSDSICPMNGDGRERASASDMAAP